MTSVPLTLSAARYGPAKSKRGNVKPVGQLNGASPHSRAPFPEYFCVMKGVYVMTILGWWNVSPKLVAKANPTPFTAPGVLENAPPVMASQPMKTSPLGPMAIDGPWLPQIPPETLIGLLKLAP